VPEIPAFADFQRSAEPGDRIIALGPRPKRTRY
jgi:hypothetical protein